jgi:hypothetical protein
MGLIGENVALDVRITASLFAAEHAGDADNPGGALHEDKG